ncbi:MAG: DUF4126 family protein [Bryobacterales bacterium]|nr:DUF4126 family protein [Bryobacterales bacterium]MEB2359988.1 DUF4126 family protein [Bryobacterales bacterium]
MTLPGLLHAFLIGGVSGLRAMTAPAAVSWGAHLGWIDLSQTPLAFLGYAATPYIVSLLAVLELIADKLPSTPSRKAPPGFIARLGLGTFSGYALSLGIGQSGVIGAVLGFAGAIAGTLGGYEARTRSAKALKVPDLVVALLEDAIAIAIGLSAVHHNQPL